jgi:hypothetical protein
MRHILPSCTRMFTCTGPRTCTIAKLVTNKYSCHYQCHGARTLIRQTTQRSRQSFDFGNQLSKYFSSSNRQPVPFTPKKVLIVSKVTLLNYESRKTYRKPWDRLSSLEKEDLTKHLEREGFQMSELIDSHG